MGILDEDVDAVRNASDIVRIVSQYTQLRQQGRRFLGRCPFHDERTPSFSVNAEQNLYFCFGCQAHGDVITFVREKEGLDFVGAIEWLAAKCGVTLHYTDRGEGEGRKKRARLIEVMVRAAAWYHERLLSAPDAGTARRYLRERGLGGEVVRDFGIGWAPDAWDELCRALQLDERTATETGLGRRNSRGRLQDHFRGRIMFPIRDDQGNTISFGGRILPGGERPGNQGKYQNTTQTPLYDKSRVLYGLDRAKAAVVASDTVIVCEGYTDVIGFARSGVPQAVATCGTALTDEHVRLLRRFARRFVLAFDADGAGQAAADRFYRWEREHDLEVAVADLPPGQDPAEVAQTDPDRLRAAVEGARPFLRFRLDRAFAAADLSTPEGRARVAGRALDLLAEHPDGLVRDQYVMDVASRCRVDPDRLHRQLEERRSQRPRPSGRRSGPSGRAPGRASGRRAEEPPPPWEEAPPPDQTPPPWDGPPPWEGSPRPASQNGHGGRSAPAASAGRARAAIPPRPALEALRHLVHNPEAVGRWLGPAVFDDPLHVELLRVLGEAGSYEAARAAAPEPVGALLTRLLVEEPDTEPFDAVRRVLSEVARREMRLLQLTTVTAEDPTQNLATVAELRRILGRLADPVTATEAADRLVAWLTQRVGDGG